MKKWFVPVVAGAAVLAVLALWANCVERPVEGFHEVKTTDLVLRAQEVLGVMPEAGAWSASALPGFALPPVAAAVVDSGGEKGDPDAVAALQKAVDTANMQTEGALLERTRAQAALVTALFRLGRESEALGRFHLLEVETRRAVDTARQLGEWQDAQAARLFFVGSVAGFERGTKPDALAEMAGALGGAGHRAALGRVLQRRFVESVLPTVSEASRSESVAGSVAKALFHDQAEEEKQLVAQLLHRHPRAFSPEQTADAGAMAVKELQAVLAGPWPPMERTLDKVAGAQKVWSDLVAFLQTADASSVSKIADVKRALDATENPVGLALLHDERTAWSSLVQAAYVAEAKEAALRASLLRAAGKPADQVLDPITGETVGKARAQVGKAYPFVKAFAESALAPGSSQ